MELNKQSLAGAETRRDFIKKAAATAAVVAATNPFKTPVYGQSSAPSAGRVIGANDRIAVGYIGIGGWPSDCPGMGLAHVESQKSHAAENNIVQAAVCDLYKTRNEHAKEKIGTSEAATIDDYRKLLDNPDVDVVWIATPEHWHAKMAIDSLEAGKHIYLEKPMTRHLDEALKVHAAVKRTGKIVQVGSQGCTDPKWHRAGELIKQGKLGKIVWSQGS